MNNKNNVKTGITLAISLVLPLFLNVYFQNITGKEIGMGYLGLWMIVNYLFVSISVELISDILDILKLKGLKIRYVSYVMNILMYVFFTIYLNAYIIQQAFAPDYSIVNVIARFEFLILLSFTFIVNLFCGIIPKKEDSENMNVYSFSPKNPIKYGRDKLATLVGKYDSGFVLGNLPIEYSDIKTIYTDKENNLIIKGKSVAGNFRISIAPSKTLDETVQIIKTSFDNDKIKANISKI